MTNVFQLFAKPIICPTMHIPQSVFNSFDDGEFDVPQDHVLACRTVSYVVRNAFLDNVGIILSQGVCDVREQLFPLLQPSL